jgi:hypothetical protein
VTHIRDTVVASDAAAPAAAGTRRGAGRRQARAAGDAEFTAFVAAAAPRLRRSAYLMCRDWHLAQDLTQITLAKMYASWPRLWRTANLEAYSRGSHARRVRPEEAAQRRRGGARRAAGTVRHRPPMGRWAMPASTGTAGEPVHPLSRSRTLRATPAT